MGKEKLHITQDLCITLSCHCNYVGIYNVPRRFCSAYIKSQDRVECHSVYSSACGIQERVECCFVYNLLTITIQLGL